MNCLNRLTAPNLDLTRSQESYKSYSWRKNIFGVTGGDPFQFHIRKKNTHQRRGQWLILSKGETLGRVPGQGQWGGWERFMEEIETWETAEKTMGTSSLDFHTRIIVDSFYKLEEILQMA